MEKKNTTHNAVSKAPPPQSKGVRHPNF